MNKTYIVIACIIAVAYIVVEASKIGYKEYLRIENLKIEQKQN